MDYASVANRLRTDFPKDWQIFSELHQTYQWHIIDKIAGNCEFLACFDEAEQVAMEVVEYLRTIPQSILTQFKILSMGYGELKEYHGILNRNRLTKRINLSRKANLARRNLRRFIGMDIGQDSCQGQYDNDKNDYAKRYIIVPDSDEPDKGLSAYDINQYHRKKKCAVNLKLVDYLESFAKLYLGYDGLFLTLTLPSEFHNCDYQTARDEISRRWKLIKSALRYRDILYLGVETIELHKDETPHYHIQLWIDPTHREMVERLISKHFPDEIERQDESIKDIHDAVKLMGYIQKNILNKEGPEAEIYINFIGLKRDIKARFDAVYRNRTYKELSDYRISLAHSIIHNRPDDKTMLLLVIRGFSDDKLNSLSSRHPYKKYICNGYQSVLVSYIHYVINGELKSFNENCKLQKRKFRTTKIVNENNKFYVFLLNLFYINQICIANIFCKFEMLKSRGQPPPAGRNWIVFYSSASE